jgi:glycerophosphoryl diester phosphodiesterase
VVAHRADWRHEPENSIPGIEAAIKMGVDMVEIDLKKSKDGVLLLMHD